MSGMYVCIYVMLRFRQLDTFKTITVYEKLKEDKILTNKQLFPD
jgi:hypothetical protein